MPKNTNTSNAETTPAEWDGLILATAHRVPVEQMAPIAVRVLDGELTMGAGQKESGAGYGPFWSVKELIRMRRLGVEQRVGLEGAQLATTVAAMRHATGEYAEIATLLGCANGKGLSWGVIALLCAKPESAVRRAYAQGTNTYSQGQRIGHGGRFMGQDITYYRGERVAEGSGVERKAFGTRLTTDTGTEVVSTSATVTDGPAPVLGKSGSRKRAAKTSTEG